mgnify:CR=1 FL=1
MNKKLGYQILELCGILLGNAILAFGIAAFVLPHGMITGGATGLGLVTSRVFGVDLSVAVAVYNIILFAVGAFVLGKKFALTTIVSTIVYPMFLSFFTQQQCRHYGRSWCRYRHPVRSIDRRAGYPAADPE